MARVSVGYGLDRLETSANAAKNVSKEVIVIITSSVIITTNRFHYQYLLSLRFWSLNSCRIDRGCCPRAYFTRRQSKKTCNKFLSQKIEMFLWKGNRKLTDYTKHNLSTWFFCLFWRLISIHCLIFMTNGKLCDSDAPDLCKNLTKFWQNWTNLKRMTKTVI